MKYGMNQNDVNYAVLRNRGFRKEGKTQIG